MCNKPELIRLDQEFATRLQNEHPEQFITLVRMHLSFELDLNTDTENDPASSDKGKIKKWKGFHKKARGCASTKTNSPETAKTVLTKQNIRDVMQLIDFLVQEKNISQEGIFRKTGSLQRQSELKNALIHKVSINLENGDFTAHDCASVLKNFLADLSEPLLTEHYYPAYCQVAELCHSKNSVVFREERLLHAIQLLVLLLPKENNKLLECIIDMLYKTVEHESTNKMSADNLATVFTPHLICPRKLSPEALHATTQQMFSIISFMITTGPRLFHIPPKLATDIRAYFVERKRRKTMSPEHILNESVTSDSVANTVYTFVDREKTAEAHVMNSTDTALAQLYAHIQSLPESSKKKKLIKQFNRENGHGTPLQVLMLREKTSGGSSNKMVKSFGDSIKRHIFHKHPVAKTPKRNSHTPVRLQTPNGSVPHVPKQRVLFQSPLPTAADSPGRLGKRSSSTSTSSSSSSESVGSSTCTPHSIVKRSNSSTSSTSTGSYRRPATGPTVLLKSIEIEGANSDAKRCRLNSDEQPSPPEDDEDFVEQEGDDIGDDDDDSHEFRAEGRTLSDNEEDRYSSPSACLSDSRSKYKSEPNLSSIVQEECRNRGIKEKKMSSLKNKLIKGVSMGSLRLPFGHDQRSGKKYSSTSLLKCCFEDNIKSARKSIEIVEDCRLIGISPLRCKAKSDANEDHEQNDMVNENNLNLEVNAWNVGYLTSTPALSGRNSMSPITKSTQRMPKSMQESIMTPRSRKPVMLLAGLNTADPQHTTYTSQSSFSSLREEDEDDAVEEMPAKSFLKSDSTALDGGIRCGTTISEMSTAECATGLIGQGTDEEGSSLTSTFRDYLLSRSVMTDSPADLSFSSQSDDFESDGDLEDFSESKMSESLLFCMNGNKPEEDDDDTLIDNPEGRSEYDNMDGSHSLKDSELPSKSELDETSL
ncbi:serine-rich adhesin for platelets isoform X1 [Armigeres subalbatus]|uniref:serine-rich adhesin for platelets isoform X1 n=1 Tax=Armigeres subalbatus TaxID=124917 RepID=UPI002ED68F00